MRLDSAARLVPAMRLDSAARLVPAMRLDSSARLDPPTRLDSATFLDPRPGDMPQTTDMTGTVDLKGARVALTGKLATMPRRRAIELVRAAGGDFASEVSGRTTLLVVGMDGWPLLADGSISKRLQRAEALRAAGRRIEIISEPAFLERIGQRTPEPTGRKTYSAEVIRNLLKVRPATLRRWEQLGLVRSEQGRFDYQDLVSLRTIAELVEQGVRPETIGRSLRGLSSVLTDVSRPLAQLKLVAENAGTLLAEFGGMRIAPDGQLMLGFDAGAASAGKGEPAAGAKILTMPADEDDEAPSVDELLEQGLLLEEEECWQDAADAYTAAITLSAHLPEGHFNLGNVLCALGRMQAAGEQYRVAASQDPAMAPAWYNLADLLDAEGRLEEAIEALLRALDAEPLYADAHYNLARLYEATARPLKAASHWRRYVELDPSSNWARVARHRLAACAGGPRLLAERDDGGRA
jgi:tetratricopeptide (TPR) repeat protein